MSPVLRWTLGISIALLILVVPTIHYRHSYRHQKRLRTVTEGKVYRSGSMTADGLESAIKKYGIKTVLNVMDEAPDPELPTSYLDIAVRDFTFGTQKESEVCKKAKANFQFFPVDFVSPAKVDQESPSAFAKFFELMDNPDNYPVLIHCKAGLHRTGVLVALYRQEYEGWSREQALKELKDNGFGEFASTNANEYISQYVGLYKAGERKLVNPK